ncbi:MAG: DHH family phosphoesterase [Elusimicrobiota bacterium]
MAEDKKKTKEFKLNLEIPPVDKEEAYLIIKEIEKASSALITFHARPDGDALGGAEALKCVLEQKGLDTCIVSPTTPPHIYDFLIDSYASKEEVKEKKFDLVFLLDCSDTSRLEGLEKIIEKSSRVINIDHHQFNSIKARVSYVRPEYSSVCELVLNVALAAKTKFTYHIAECLYTGILTDTNRFQEKNSTPRAHRIAAEFIEKGIVPVDVSSKIYGRLSLNRLNLLAKCINAIRFSPSRAIAYIVITPRMLDETGTKDEGTEGIINYARNIEGVQVGIIFRKIPGLSGIKVSIRSKGRVDVGRLSEKFGGGGHHNAGGFLLKGSFEKVVKRVLSEVEKCME